FVIADTGVRVSLTGCCILCHYTSTERVIDVYPVWLSSDPVSLLRESSVTGSTGVAAHIAPAMVFSYSFDGIRSVGYNKEQRYDPFTSSIWSAHRPGCPRHRYGQGSCSIRAGWHRAAHCHEHVGYP